MSSEARWLAEVYQGGSRQLTARAVVAGMLIGMVMCLSNLYVVLKTGWSAGVTITAVILAWTLFKVAKRLHLVKQDFSILENNAMGSVASAAGYMTGGGNMAAIPALLMLTGALPSSFLLVLWFTLIAGLGVFAAIPIKRQLINVEALAFPTGTATAETLRALHQTGEGAGGKARLLTGAGLVGATIAFFRDFSAGFMPFNLPSHFGLPFDIRGIPAAKWTLSLEGSVLMLGVGALMSFRIGWSVLLGSLIGYGLIAPELVAQGIVKEVGYRPIVQWLLWPGAAILVASGLTSFAFQWRTVTKSVRELASLLRKKTDDDASDPMRAIECPAAWFPLGFVVLGPAVVVLAWMMFGIPLWAGLIGLPLSVIMGVIAARVTGETDVTPTKALGPVTQLIYGGLLPGNLTANIMGANITGGVGLHAADLLTDLKSGFLLGANPRQQFYAQLFGVVAGAVIVVPAFRLIVPEASVLGSEAFPAPSVQVWAGVSKVLSVGASALHPTARIAALIGLVLGVILALLERFAPNNLKRFVPAPSGLGIAFVMPAYNGFMIFIGALAAEILRKKRGATAGDEVSVPVSSGFIAGESLMGIFLAMLKATGLIGR